MKKQVSHLFQWSQEYIINVYFTCGFIYKLLVWLKNFYDMMNLSIIFIVQKHSVFGRLNFENVIGK